MPHRMSDFRIPESPLHRQPIQAGSSGDRIGLGVEIYNCLTRCRGNCLQERPIKVRLSLCCTSSMAKRALQPMVTSQPARRSPPNQSPKVYLSTEQANSAVVLNSGI